MNQHSLPDVIQGFLVTISDTRENSLSEYLSPTVVAIIAAVSTTVLFVVILNKLIGVKRAILIIGALICGFVGFLVGTDFLRDFDHFAESESEARTDPGDAILAIDVGYIYFAAQDIKRGTEPYEEEYVSFPLPNDLIMDFYIQNENYIDGSLAVADIKRGMILTTDLLVNTSFEQTGTNLP